MAPAKVAEGLIPFDIPGAGKSCQTWFQIHGDIEGTKKPPLIIVHGGPGGGHEYCRPMADLSVKYDIPVIFYDQIGCARSTTLDEKSGDTSFWSVELFVRELDNLIDHFSLRSKGYDVWGQSWGAMLAGDWASRKPKGLRKLILANGPFSSKLHQSEVRRLVNEMPEDIARDILVGEEKFEYDSPQYMKAYEAFCNKHFCLLQPWPEDFVTTINHMTLEPTVYNSMFGPSELTINGALEDWEAGDANQIDVPTLIIGGEHDEVTKASYDKWLKEIPNSKGYWFEEASHVPHMEQRTNYMVVINEFLNLD